MKKLLFFLLIFSQVVYAQKRDPRTDQFNYVPNEVLVKFVDNVAISDKATTLKSTGIVSIDNILKSSGIEKMEKLFPNEKKLKATRIVKDPQGQDMVIPSLHNIYKLTLPTFKSEGKQPSNIKEYIERLEALPEVEYAEPNYIYSIDDLEPIGPILTADDVVKLLDTKLKRAQDAVVPNDPLYSQQWHIPAVKADLVWEQTTGDTNQIIAILDTGVDWTHPDLKNKIWNNKDEIPDNGNDDDGNGLIDDIRGWDYINNDNNPTDDNSHGTHVAGIAAAESDNGIGIAGVSWKAKIMPIKVFQSSGYGDFANIAKGILYASQKGATVINMSFGSYARSMAMEDVLANAYATSVLVAAAGNDDFDLNKFTNSFPPYYIHYPAALSYVLGVQATQSELNIFSRGFKNGTYFADFTNYDSNDPFYSFFSDLFNYELSAPGSNIVSTIPNGNYRVFSGTSMASPLVAGIVGLYISVYKDKSQEQLWASLINNQPDEFDDQLDAYAAIYSILKPNLRVINYTINDTLEFSDSDDRIDAGETIDIYPLIQDFGEFSDSCYVGIEFPEFEDQTALSFLISESFVGSISSYAKRKCTNPLRIKISPSVANDRTLKLNLLSWAPNVDTTRLAIELLIENGQELAGVMDSTFILTPDRYWIVKDAFRVGSLGKLIIKPGVHLKIYNNIDIRGELVCNGTKDSLIYIEGPGLWTGVRQNLSYINFSNFQTAINSDSISNCIINDNRIEYAGDYLVVGSAYDCLFINPKNYRIVSGAAFRCNFINNILQGASSSVSASGSFNNIVKIRNVYDWLGYQFLANPMVYLNQIGSENNVYFSNQEVKTPNIVYLWKASGADYDELPNNYYGTINTSNFAGSYIDFSSGCSSCALLRFANILRAPVEQAHGIVWKVLINGKNPYDEDIEPVGVGKQRFDVYFNRPMDKSVTPNVSFGVRYPYSQQAVNEEGYWSEDGRIYTVYKTIKLTTGDGINRVRVTSAKEANGWDNEIPIEDMRFNFLISASSSASLEFTAIPGLGKVNLEWNNNNLEDGLGYNMYRMEPLNDSVLTQPVMINNELIADTLYTDFDVSPNKKYYYYYKILRTNLFETDSSRTIAAIPLTAKLGDSNGDFDVNVMDLVHSVDYILGNNPTPFIFEAADVNADTYINVLDVVGTVDIILHPSEKRISTAHQEIRFISNNPVGEAYLYWEGDDLYVESIKSIAGIQLAFANDFTYSLSGSLTNFEWLTYTQDEQKVLMMYSFTGLSLAPGKTKLLTKTSTEAILDISKAVVATPQGFALTPIFKDSGELLGIDAPIQTDQVELIKLSPNPSTGIYKLQYYLPEQMDKVLIQVYSLKGELLWAGDNFKNTKGPANTSVDLSHLNDGIYLMVMDVLRSGEIKKREVKKIIISKNL